MQEKAFEDCQFKLAINQEDATMTIKKQTDELISSGETSSAEQTAVSPGLLSSSSIASYDGTSKPGLKSDKDSIFFSSCAGVASSDRLKKEI